MYPRSLLNVADLKCTHDLCLKVLIIRKISQFFICKLPFIQLLKLKCFAWACYCNVIGNLLTIYVCITSENKINQ